jgi:glycine oxidase
MWRAAYPGLIQAGSLVVAAPRDTGELTRFGRMTTGHELIGADRLAALEPDLGGRFQRGLWYADEAHLETPKALAFLLKSVREAGVDVRFGVDWTPKAADPGLVIDCRGLAARQQLPDLRGVRGERLLIRSREVRLRRPVRLLHPRAAFYMVPWSDGVHLIGATVVESEDDRPMTARAALELLGLAYALHPGFGEAEILETSSGVRPAFPNNVPQVRVEGDRISVNGAYRHGYLLAPVMAKVVADWLSSGARHPDFLVLI